VTVVRTPRLLVLLFAVVAAIDAAVSGGAGALNLALYAAPLLVMAGLLLSGRFVGEERIIARARRARDVPKLLLALRAGWSGRPERPLVSLLERAPRSLRGPPARLAAV
jgi:hypothetical protein